MSQNYLVFLRAFRHIAAAQASGRIFMISKTGIVNVKIDLGGLPNLSRRPRNLAGCGRSAADECSIRSRLAGIYRDVRGEDSTSSAVNQHAN